MMLCWVDAGPAFGLGHVSRTLALAEALAAHGAPCRMALPPDPTALAWIAASGLPRPIVLPESDPPLPHVLAAAAGATAVVVDVRHPLERPEVRALGGERPLLVVDNAGPGTADADLVLAPFGMAPPGPAGERWLVGPSWVPLRRVFRDVVAGARGREPVVLVSMGASDPGGLAVPVVEGLGRARAAGTALAARVVANPLAPVWGRLPALLERLGMPPASPVDPERMPEHFAAASVAVLAMGVTVYEALAAGVPAIVLCRTSADVAHARTLEGAGAIVSAGLHWSEERIATLVATLLADGARRDAMARAGRALVDGQGAERVAARLLALVGREEGRHAAERAGA